MTSEQTNKPSPAPTVGRIVHFYDAHQTTPLPAIVVETMTGPEYVDLHVFGVVPKAAQRLAVRYGEEPRDDGPRWCYPPRV